MVLFDPHRYAYPSRRSVVYARRAMACTSVPLGAQVGLDVMKAGGNAVDAAVAMAAAMPLLEPTGEKAVRPERQRRVPYSSVRRPGAGAGLRGDA